MSHVCEAGHKLPPIGEKCSHCGAAQHENCGLAIANDAAEIARLREEMADEFARGFCTAEEAFRAELSGLRRIAQKQQELIVRYVTLNVELVAALRKVDARDPAYKLAVRAALRSATEKGVPT